MKNPLAIELRQLFPDARLRQLIAVAELIGPHWEDHRRTACKEGEKMCLPKLQPGETFARDSFWYLFSKKMIWHWAFYGSPEKQAVIADWLRKQRAKYAQRGNWPPAPITSRRIVADHKAHYAAKMETIIGHFKSKLD